MSSKTIDISTTQNVVITYEQAGLIERILAWLLDLVCLIILIAIIGLLASEMAESGSFYMEVLQFLVIIFYSLFWEIFNNGRSPGKMALGLQVLKINGMSAGPMEYFSRWVVRWADIYGTLGALGGLLILTNKHGQRLGDMLANTAVVRKSNRFNIGFKDLLRLHESEPPEIIYPEAAKLNEEQVLLIRETIDRYLEFGNGSHKIAMDNLYKKVCEWCNIIPRHKNTKQFLDQVIRDYVQLTR